MVGFQLSLLYLLAYLNLHSFCVTVHLQDSNKAAAELSISLRENCLGNLELLHYNDSNLVSINRILEHGGCIWDPHNNSSAPIEAPHHRRKRAAGPAKEGSNPLITDLVNVAHVLHIASIVILAIMVVEVRDICRLFYLFFYMVVTKLKLVD